MKRAMFRIIPSLIFTSLIFSSGTYAIISSERNEEDISITFMANGGKFSDDLSYKTKQFPYGCTWGAIKENLIPKPTYSGYDLVKWTYEASKTSTKVVGDSDTFTKDTTIYAQWGANDPGTFASDSWATIINVANGYTKESTTYYGLEALKKAYENDIAEYGNSFVIQDISNEEEVIKKTRTVTLNGLGTYNVRVVGENHDLIAGETNKAASLTFEFMNMIVPGVTYNLTGELGEYTDYTTSHLRNFLQNDIMSTMPEVLKTNMKTVTKKIVKGGSGSDKDTIVTFDDKLFPLSSSEIGLTETGSKVSKYTVAPLEGSAYPYYYHNANNKSSMIKNYVDTYESSGKTITKSVSLPYWLRSHKNNDQYTRPTAYCIDEKFGNITENRVDYYKGVAPLFCIGTSNASNIRQVSYTESGSATGKTILHSDNFVGEGSEYIGSIKFTNAYSTYKVTSISVKVGSESLKQEMNEFKYDSTTGRIYIPIFVFDRYSGNVSITGNIIKDGFEADSWERFLSNCSKGYDYLISTSWSEDGQNCGYKEIYEANGNTFVGLKRPLEVLRYKFKQDDPDVYDKYWVRVIGELTDTYYVDSKLRSSLFTFEFTEVLKYEELDYDHTSNYDYVGSLLDKRLNSPEDNQNLIGRLRENGVATPLSNSIVGVDKKVYYKPSENDDPTIKTANLKMFEPSTRELGYIIDGIEDGEIYEYYEDGDLTKTIKVSENSRTVSEKTPVKSRVYTTCDENRYWSRTPNFERTPWSEDLIGYVYNFGSYEDDGYIGANVNYTYGNYHDYQYKQTYTSDVEAVGYAPAFCIGNVAPRFRVTNSTRGYNFTGAAKAEYGTTYNAEITSKSCEVNGTTYTPNKIPTKDQIKIIVNGVDVTETCYSRSEDKGIITIPGESITGKVSININDVPLNLTWSQLGILANYDETENKQGEFVKEYIHDGGYLTFEEADTEKTVRKVKVIGYGHDPLKSNVSKNAALTLEFSDVLGTDTTSPWVTSYDDGSGAGAMDFTKTKVHKLLNTYFEEKLPVEIHDMIKTVRKDYTKYNASNESWDYSKFDTNLFILSYNEYNTTFMGYGERYVEYGYLLDNSKAYDYYQGSVKGTPELNAKRTKSCTCFIRSSMNIIDRGRYYANFLMGDDEFVHQLEGTPGLVYFTDNRTFKYTDPFAICPAFCI